MRSETTVLTKWNNKKGANDMQLGGVGQAAPEQEIPGAAPPTSQQMMEEMSKKTTVDTLNALAGKGFFGKGKGGGNPQTKERAKTARAILRGVSREKGAKEVKAQGNLSKDGAINAIFGDTAL